MITTAIYNHSHGCELRVFLDDEKDDNLLHSEIVRFDFAPLEQKAANAAERVAREGPGASISDRNSFLPMRTSSTISAIRPLNLV